MTRCPHCFLPLPPDLFAFRCTSSACQDSVDVALSTYRGTEERGLPVTNVSSTAEVTSAYCDECRLPTSAEVCPECHYALLPGWRWCTTTCLAMAGPRDSGKSIYIAVLIKQAELWSERQRRALVAADARTEEMYSRVYETPLYERRGLIPPTPSAVTATAHQREPLLFDMGQIDGRQHMLVLRDVAGEDLEDTGTAVAPFRFFSQADLVVFLFDPLRLDEVRGQLEGMGVPRAKRGGDPLEVLRNLIRLMHDGLLLGQKLAAPLAVVLAKFDTLNELAHVEGGPLADVMGNVGATFSLDPSMDGSLDTADQDRLQAEVRSLLVRLKAGTLLNVVESSFADPRLFAVSALGAMPYDEETVSARGIAPFRVLDPLKWALARSGAIGQR